MKDERLGMRDNDRKITGRKMNSRNMRRNNIGPPLHAPGSPSPAYCRWCVNHPETGIPTRILLASYSNPTPILLQSYSNPTRVLLTSYSPPTLGKRPKTREKGWKTRESRDEQNAKKKPVQYDAIRTRGKRSENRRQDVTTEKSGTEK